MTEPKPQPARLRGRPKFEDVAAIEDRLLSVALSEFVRVGYGGASMTKIVQVAGVSKTTLYSRFASKEELFRAIMRQQIERLGLAASLTPHEGPLSLVQGLKAYANGALSYGRHGDWHDINRLIYSESHRFPELGEATAETTRWGIGHISDFIRRCADADDIPCQNPEAVAEVFICMMRGWSVNALIRNRQPSQAEQEKWVDRAVHTLIAGRADW